MTVVGKVFDKEAFKSEWKEVLGSFTKVDIDGFLDKVGNDLEKRETVSEDEIFTKLVTESVEKVSMEEADWTYVSARIQLDRLYKQAAENRGYDKEDKYGDYINLQNELIKYEVYSDWILKNYSEAELKEAEGYIDSEHDNLFTYAGIKTLASRYLADDKNGNVFELPQERYLTIALYLMSEETENRMEKVKEAYWAMANHYMTVATPTLANTGKTYSQLSSCFINATEDSLQGIYDDNTDIANLSKNGGGIGTYLGKVRSSGSDIKEFKGVASGVIPWIRQLNNTAVSVDQLGQRSGAIAAYLDIWHKDIFSFLDMKLNNGDQRMRALDLFYGVCIPDVFMEAVEARESFYLFDPHEVHAKKGWALEDYYDEEKGNGTFREKYYELVNDDSISKEEVKAIDIMKRIMVSQLETGTPYMFYRDEVNRNNPNSHKGMIYCSNLCTEISQNVSPTMLVEEEMTEDGKLITVREPGDMVVCNLSSLHLANVVSDDVIQRVVHIQMRMLDNVIDLNTLPLKQATRTNKNYRSVGLGFMSWAQVLAEKGIAWESDEAIEYADNLVEEIAFYTIEASKDLAEEKGAYPYFEGSEWHTGVHFDKRGYDSEGTLDWDRLKKEVNEVGVRNGYMMAPAPNASTSLILNATAGTDPIFKKVYTEEKKDYKAPVVVPGLNAKTTWYYKAAHLIDQHYSIEQNSRRQKHVDQALSFNLYVTNDIKAKELLDLHLHAWKAGLKTTYYVRSTAISIDDCESCSS